MGPELGVSLGLADQRSKRVGRSLSRSCTDDKAFYRSARPTRSQSISGIVAVGIAVVRQHAGPADFATMHVTRAPTIIPRHP